jgi:hypothetical protein
MNPVAYILLLDDLNQMTAQYAWVDPDTDRVVRLSLPRTDWEQAGRPGSIRVEVSQG